MRTCFVLLLVSGPALATDPALFVQPGGPPQFVAACVSCGPRERSGFGSEPGARVGPLHALLYPFTIGEGCRMPAGCSNYFAERTFLWGSCRQFYTPGNKCSAFPNRGACNGGNCP